MRILGATALLLAAASQLFAQAVQSEFVYDRDYTFERQVATRVVHDAEDNGTIRLVTYVWRPLKNDRHEIVLFSHGSTGGMTRSPKEPGAELPPFPLVQFFVARGYTVVAPARRGRGESGGNYVEECSVQAGKCTPAQQLALTDRGVREALLDENAVIDQLILGRLVPRQSQILLVGHSRGGFLSLLLAAQRPTLVQGVINFAGGWHGVNDRVSAPEFKERMDTQTVRLAAAAKQFRKPTIWIYAARDFFYNEAGKEGLLRAWRDAGGQAEYVFIAEHALPNAHLALSSPPLWSARVQEYLKTIDAAK